MEDDYNTQRLLALRKSTRAISDLLRAQMREYLSTLAPLLHPRSVLGSYVEGGGYDASRTGEKPFKELKDLYQKIARSKSHSLPTEFKTPLEIINIQLEMTPVEYQHVVQNGAHSKTIAITSPLKWALTYKGFGPARLREVLKTTDRKTDELQQFVLHYLMIHSVVSNQPGLSRILDALHFPLSVENADEFGELPLTYIASSISTLRPPDAVLVESTEVSGTDAFEELVQLEGVEKLRDPLKERLIDLTKDL
jgi:hypothetical protein